MPLQEPITHISCEGEAYLPGRATRGMLRWFGRQETGARGMFGSELLLGFLREKQGRADGPV